MEKSKIGAEPKRISDEQDRFDNEKIYLQRDVFEPIDFGVLAKYDGRKSADIRPRLENLYVEMNKNAIKLMKQNFETQQVLMLKYFSYDQMEKVFVKGTRLTM